MSWGVEEALERPGLFSQGGLLTAFDIRNDQNCQDLPTGQGGRFLKAAVGKHGSNCWFGLFLNLHKPVFSH